MTAVKLARIGTSGAGISDEGGVDAPVDILPRDSSKQRMSKYLVNKRFFL